MAVSTFLRFLIGLLVVRTQSVPRHRSAASHVIATSSSGAHKKLPYPLDIDELRRLGLSSDDVIHHIRVLLGEKAFRDGAWPSGRRVGNEMKRNFIRNQSVTCNDGSKAGYYLRKSSNSSRWLVYLEDGWFCIDRLSCQNRWLTSQHLMSSSDWPIARKGIGILSSDAEENPFIHDGNLVQVPYCSSDSWSGSYRAKQNGDFSFMGSLILDEVIRDLVKHHGLLTAKRLYLAGSSAGGTGVLLNLDRVTFHLRTVAPSLDVRGIADSGWFLDNQQFRETRCLDETSCSPVESARRGIQLWHGIVPEACKSRHRNENWKCYFGYRIYETLQTPVFVVQPLFDDAQLMADNVGPPVTREQWTYIHNLGLDMKNTLSNVSAVFAPACMSHGILGRNAWSQFTIHGTTLPESLRCWESGRTERNHYTKSTAQRKQYLQLTHRLIAGEKSGRRPRDSDSVADDEPWKSSAASERQKTRGRTTHKDTFRTSSGKRIRHRGKHSNSLRSRHERRRSFFHRRNQTRRRNKEGQIQLNDTSLFSAQSIGFESHQPSSGNTRTRPKRSSSLFDEHDFHHISRHENRCSHHRLDYCNWPQCNLSCPKMRNPFTGDEMDLVDLLKQLAKTLSRKDSNLPQHKARATD